MAVALILPELSSLVLHLLFQFQLIQLVLLGPQPALGACKEPETSIVIILVVQPGLEGRGTHGQFRHCRRIAGREDLPVAPLPLLMSCRHNGVGANPVMLIVVSPLPHSHRRCHAGIHVTIRSLLHATPPPCYRWTVPLLPHCREGGLIRSTIALVDVAAAQEEG